MTRIMTKARAAAYFKMQTVTGMNPPFCTSVNRLAYDFETRMGRVDMPEGCCVDMGGTIYFFEEIDPQVQRIETYGGAKADTFYVRDGDGKWHSFLDGRQWC